MSKAVTSICYPERQTQNNVIALFRDKLGYEYLGNWEVTVPQRAEQCAIAAVLFDLDTEIEALEEELKKLVDLKQGMMQNLLTGRIRLV